MDRSTLKAMAKEQIKGNIGVLFGITLVGGIVSALINLIPGVGSAIGLLIVTPAMNIALCHIYLNLTKGVKPEVKELFAHFSEFWGAFKVTFLTGLFTILWMLLLIIPGYVKAISYSQAMYVLAENPGMGARQALKQSQQMMDGHKMEYFVMMLSFIGWILLSMVTFGIALIWGAPYMTATMANFYNSVKPEIVYEAEPVVGPEF